MKPESFRWRSAFVLTLAGLLVVLPAVSGAADQKDDKGGGDDTTAVGHVNNIISGAAEAKRAKADKALQDEWNVRHQVDEKMNFEQAKKVSEKQQALDAANSHVQQDAQTLSQRKADVYNADGKRAAAELKESQTKSAYENAQRQADAARQNAAKQNGGTDPAKQNAAKQEAAKLQEKANKLKTDYDDASKAASKAREDLGKAQQAQVEAKNKLQTSKKAATQAETDLTRAKKVQESVAKHSTTTEGPPKTKTSKIEKVATAINVIQHADAVIKTTDAANKGDYEEFRKESAGVIMNVADEVTLGGASAAKAVVEAGVAGKGYFKEVDKANSREMKNEQAMSIARDLRASGKFTTEEATRLAEGYVNGSEREKALVDNAYNKMGKSVPERGTVNQTWAEAGATLGESAIETLTDVGLGVADAVGNVGRGVVNAGEIAVGLTEKGVAKELASTVEENMSSDNLSAGAEVIKQATGENFDAAVETVKGFFGRDEKSLQHEKIVESLMRQGATREQANDVADRYQADKEASNGGASKVISDFLATLRKPKEEAEKEVDEAQSLREAEGGELPPAGDVTSVAEGPAGGSLGGFTKDLEVERTGETASDNAFVSLTTTAREQEGWNEQVEISSRITLEEGATAAQEISRKSAVETAAAQDANSWGDAIADGIEQGVSAGLVAMGTSFGGALGDEIGQRAANSLFGEPKHNNHYDDDWQPSGGGGGSVSSGGDSGHTFTITQVADGNGNPVGKDSTASGEESGDGGDSGHTFTITQVADGNGNPVGKDSTPSTQNGSTSSDSKTASKSSKETTSKNTTGLKCVFCGEMKALKWMPHDGG